MEVVLGIDVGASGIKGALVDTEKGEMITDRIKYLTPKSGKPKKMLRVMEKIVDDFDWKGKPIGVGFPSIIKHGVCHSASNIHDSWVGFDLLQEMKDRFSEDVYLGNDADVAGIAEMECGQGKISHEGIIIMLTLGTGIGSAIFHNGILLPNTELGQLKYKKGVTEEYGANSVRERNNLSWKKWGKQLDKVIEYIHFIFSPDKFVLGGGVSKKYDRYKKYLSLSDMIVPASLLNNAGIIGAAIAMHKKHVAVEAKQMIMDSIDTENP